MKLKCLLGITLAASLTLGSVSAFADTGTTESCVVGTPIDLSTGSAVEDYEAGQLIALPVDFYSSTGTALATGISLNFDTDVLSYGIAVDTLKADTAALTKATGLGQIKYSSDKSYVVAVNNIYTEDALTGEKEYEGLTEPPSSSTGKVKIGWANGSAITLSDEPELYIFFTVIGTVDSLNYDLFTINESESLVDATSNITGTADKANACDGAFQIVVDSSKLEYWVQGVTATVNEKEYPLVACLNEEGSTTYTFPVRVTSESGDTSVNIAITATVSDDKAGEENLRIEEWSTVEVTDMTGTVTGYTNVSATE